MNSESVSAHIRPAQVETWQNPSMEKGSGHKVPSLMKKPFVRDVGEGKPVFFTGVTIVSTNHTPGQALCSETAGQPKMDSAILFVYLLSFVCVWLSSERKYESGWERIGVRIWGELEERMWSIHSTKITKQKSKKLHKKYPFHLYF